MTLMFLLAMTNVALVSSYSPLVSCNESTYGHPYGGCTGQGGTGDCNCLVNCPCYFPGLYCPSGCRPCNGNCGYGVVSSLNELQAIQWNNLHSCNYTHQYRTSNATATTFGRCANATTVCPTSTYMLHSHTATTNTICANITNCSGSTPFQLLAPSSTSDRTCTNTSTYNCSLGATWASSVLRRASVTPATATTSCACNKSTPCISCESPCCPGSPCGPPIYGGIHTYCGGAYCCGGFGGAGGCGGFNCSAGAGSASQAIQWNNNRSCDFGSQYLTTSATPIAFGECANLIDCTGATPYQAVAPTRTSARTCTSTSINCSLGATWASANATATTSCACSPVTDCWSFSEWASMAATVSRDAVCNPFTDCTVSSTWSALPATPTSNVVCSEPLTECTLGTNYESRAPTVSGRTPAPRDFARSKLHVLASAFACAR
jgi:hypothetical protein